MSFSARNNACVRVAFTFASSRTAWALARSLRLRDRCLKKRRINLRDYLACFDLRIKIDKQLRDVAGDLAADLDIDHGIEGAGRGDHLGQRTRVTGTV